MKDPGLYYTTKKQTRDSGKAGVASRSGCWMLDAGHCPAGNI